MIPKRIYMTWFGDIPDYVEFSSSKFKEVNPDYEFVMINRSIEELEDIYYSKNNLSDIDLLINKSGHELVNYNIKNNRSWPFITSFNDILREKLLLDFGGIYIDCDMFPIKPFDDRLLLLESFRMCRCLSNLDLCFESGFRGCSPGNLYREVKSLFPIMEMLNNIQELKDKFYKCKLLYGEHYGDLRLNYVDHYGRYQWNPDKCKLPKTRMDSEMEKFGLKVNWVD